MNKTQKGAVAVFALSIVLLIFSITVPIAWFTNIPIMRQAPLFFFVLTYMLMGLLFVFLRKKQSAREVDYDERDAVIKRKAILASYITLWILVFTACTVPYVIVDFHGLVPAGFTASNTLPVMVLPIVLFLMFVIVMLVYSITILIQYGRGDKGEKS
jgi:hypothetical protein